MTTCKFHICVRHMDISMCTQAYGQQTKAKHNTDTGESTCNIIDIYLSIKYTKWPTDTVKHAVTYIQVTKAIYHRVIICIFVKSSIHTGIGELTHAHI